MILLTLAQRQKVTRVRVGPELEAYVDANYDAGLVIVDYDMAPGRIEVTPIAYAENIECTIGFVNPPGAVKP